MVSPSDRARRRLALGLIVLGGLLLARNALGQAGDPLPEPFAAQVEAARAALAAAPDPAAARHARLQLAELLEARADRWDDLRARADGDERAQAATRAQAAYGEAADLAATVVAALWPEVQRARAADEEAADDATVQGAWFLECRTRLGQGHMALAGAGADDDARRDGRRLVAQALERAEALAWEYDGWWVGYWATLTGGRCHAVLGHWADATTALRAVLALPVEGDTAALRQAAWWRLAEACFDAGRHAEALKACAELAREYPHHLESATGQSAAITQARTLAATGDLDAAVDAALAVARAAQRHRYAVALDWLAHWSERLPEASAEVRWLAGEAWRRQAALGRGPEGYTRAIRAYQQAAQSAHTPTERRAYAIAAWLAVGDCYAAMNQWTEAAIAYGRGASGAAVDRAAAGDCAERAYHAWQRAAAIDPSDANRTHVQTARERLLTDFPERVDGSRLQYAAARDLERAERLLDAAAAYERIARDDPAWRRAQVRAGACRLRAYREHPDDAALIDAAVRTLQAARDAGPDDDLGGLARYLLAVAASERHDSETVCRELAGFVARHRRTPGLSIDTAAWLRIQALLTLGRVDEAERDLEELARVAPTSDRLSLARLAVARALDARAAGDPAAAVRAAALYVAWMSAKDDPPTDHLVTVALRCRQAAEALRADRPVESRRWYRAAADRYRRARHRGDMEAEAGAAVLLDLAGCEEWSARLADAAGDDVAAMAAWERAEPLLRELQEAHPKHAGLRRRLADCCMAVTEPGDAPDRAARLARAAELWVQVQGAAHTFAPPWWEARWWYLETLRRQGRRTEVQELLRNLVAVASTLGGPDWRPRFVALGRRVGLPDDWADRR